MFVDLDEFVARGLILGIYYYMNMIRINLASLSTKSTDSTIWEAGRQSVEIVEFVYMGRWLNSFVWYGSFLAVHTKGDSNLKLPRVC